MQGSNTPSTRPDWFVPKGSNHVIPQNNVLELTIPGGGLTDNAVSAFEQLIKGNPDIKAIVIRTQNANGAVPTNVLPLIQSATEIDIPIFCVSENIGVDHGITDVRYQVHRDMVDAGAVLLRDVNVNQLHYIEQTVQSAINFGLTGSELKLAIIEVYGQANGSVVPEQTAAHSAADPRHL